MSSMLNVNLISQMYCFTIFLTNNDEIIDCNNTSVYTLFAFRGVYTLWFL